MTRVDRAMRRLRGRYYSFVIRLRGGRCGKNLLVEDGFWLRHGPHAGITLGDDVYVGRNVVFDVPRGGTLAVGNRVTLTYAVFIAAQSAVCLGDDVLVGEFTSIRDADHAIAPEAPIAAQPQKTAPVTVEGGAWIARGCAVLRGVTVGAGAVVAANSVVKSDVPAMHVAAGAPARIVKQR